MRRLIPLIPMFMSACTGTSVAHPPTVTPSPSSATSASPAPVDSPAPTNASAEPSAAATGTPTRSVCRNPTEHVYHPYRLVVSNPCMTVTGVIDRIKEERDGDYHVRLRLDAQFANLINTANLVQQAGDLVLEPVCIHAISQADAVSACAGFTNRMSVPPRGTHVSATGAYVLDTDHGWMELHPLWDIHPG